VLVDAGLVWTLARSSDVNVAGFIAVRANWTRQI
jgi:hypothetical protein